MKTVVQVAIPPLATPLDPKRFRRTTEALVKALGNIAAVHTVVFTAAHSPALESRNAQWLMARQLVHKLRSLGNIHLLATPTLLATDNEIRKNRPPTFSSEWTVANGMHVHYEAYATFVSLSSEVFDMRGYANLFERVQRKAPYSIIAGAPKLWLYDGDAWADRARIQELHSSLIADHNEDYAPDVILYCSGVPDQARGPLCTVVKGGHPIWFLDADADPDELRIHHLEFPSDRDRRADRQFFRLQIQHKNELLQRAVRLEVGEDLDQRDLWWSPLYMKVRDELEQFVERVAAKDLSIATYPVGSYWPEVIPLWSQMVGDPIRCYRNGRAIHDPDQRPIVIRRVPSELLFPELGKEGRRQAGPMAPLSERIRPFVELIADNLTVTPNSRVRVVLVVHDFDELVDNQERGGQPEDTLAVVNLDEQTDRQEQEGKRISEDELRLAIWRSLEEWKGYRRGDRLATSLVFLFRYDRHQAIRDNLLRAATLQNMANLLGDPQPLKQLSAEQVLKLARTYQRLVPVSGQQKPWAIHGEFLHPVMDYLLAETTAQFVHLVDNADGRDSKGSPSVRSRLGSAASGAMTWLSGELDAICGQEGTFFREGYALQRYFEDGPKARSLPLSKVEPLLGRIADKVEEHKILEHIFDNPIEIEAHKDESEVLNALVDLGYLEKNTGGYVVRKPLVFLGWSRWRAHGEASMFQSEAK